MHGRRSGIAEFFVTEIQKLTYQSPYEMFNKGYSEMVTHVCERHSFELWKELYRSSHNTMRWAGGLYELLYQNLASNDGEFKGHSLKVLHQQK